MRVVKSTLNPCPLRSLHQPAGGHAHSGPRGDGRQGDDPAGLQRPEKRQRCGSAARQHNAALHLASPTPQHILSQRSLRQPFGRNLRLLPAKHSPPARCLQVQEYFGDFIALEGHHFLVPLQRPHLALQPFSWDFGNSSDAIARMTEGVASLMLSLRRRFLIR